MNCNMHYLILTLQCYHNSHLLSFSVERLKIRQLKQVVQCHTATILGPTGEVKCSDVKFTLFPLPQGAQDSIADQNNCRSYFQFHDSYFKLVPSLLLSHIWAPNIQIQYLQSFQQFIKNSQHTNVIFKFFLLLCSNNGRGSEIFFLILKISFI